MIGIIGAGPAGLTLGNQLKEDVVVYEREKDLAVKPCSWVVLSNGIKFRKNEILFKIRKYRIYLDNKLIHEVQSDAPFAYIIDKKRFLERLSDGINIIFNSYAVIHKNKVISNGKEITYDKIFDARGYQALPASFTVPAIQYDTDFKAEEDTLNSYFFSDFIGYGWVFPGKYGAKIGIGGDKNFKVLLDRLSYLLKGRKINYGVARISISGLKHSGVGEAAGAVFPITGEGIRASIIHAKLISKNEDVSKSSLYRIIKEQINIINEAKKRKKPGEYISRVFVGKK
jgi:flavin-dependent dehydrogenase